METSCYSRNLSSLQTCWFVTLRRQDRALMFKDIRANHLDVWRKQWENIRWSLVRSGRAAVWILSSAQFSPHCSRTAPVIGQKIFASVHSTSRDQMPQSSLLTFFYFCRTLSPTSRCSQTCLARACLLARRWCRFMVCTEWNGWRIFVDSLINATMLNTRALVPSQRYSPHPHS